MKLLSIAVLSIILFFVVFIALHPLFGDEAAWIAAFMMYIGLPVLFLKFWRKEWEGPVVRAGNYLIALVVLCCSIWFGYLAFTGETEKLNAIMFFLVYGYGALHFLAFGRLHFKLR
jgi:hypothetical protein